jgi:hypothetical protein
VKINVKGKDVEATPIKFVPVYEPFVEYHLDNGDVIRMKYVMTRILATGERNAQGEPIYSLNWQAVAVVDEKAASNAN